VSVWLNRRVDRQAAVVFFYLIKPWCFMFWNQLWWTPCLLCLLESVLLPMLYMYLTCNAHYIVGVSVYVSWSLYIFIFLNMPLVICW